jgi:coatomer subunit zeta
MSPGLTLYAVNAIIILSIEDGSRLYAKYYTAPHAGAGQNACMSIQTLLARTCTKCAASQDRLLIFRKASTATAGHPYPDVKAQKAFEKGLLEKTSKQTGDILLYDGRVVCYKTESDTMVYVVGGADENEVLLYNVLLAVRDSLHLLFKFVQTHCRARLGKKADSHAVGPRLIAEQSWKTM